MVTLANSEDLDKMQQNAVFLLGFTCLLRLIKTNEILKFKPVTP